jgi:glucose/arabinose dehydrogenase
MNIRISLALLKKLQNVAFLWLASVSISFAAPVPLEKLQLPKRFEVSIYASGLDTPRQLALADNGVVFVGTMHDKVYALEPSADLKKTDKINIIAEKLNYPNGVAFKDGSLYVAEIQRISEYTDILDHLQAPLPSKVISTALPDKTWHGFRYIKFGPDGWLYMGIGMPCNSCIQDDKRLGTLSRISLNHPEKLEVFAHGLRNSVGFAWNPVDHVLWFTDNGQDMLGDDLPPEELNQAPKPGMDFGFPYFYGDNVPAPHYKGLKSSQGMTPPVLALPAHAAPLGMTFYSGNLFPADYKDSIFVALHGSWNRSKKSGYQVVRVTHQGEKVKGFETFISGWLENNQQVWGRPVDVLVMPDGALLISDDMSGVIYRVDYKG